MTPKQIDIIVTALHNCSDLNQQLRAHQGKGAYLALNENLIVGLTRQSDLIVDALIVIADILHEEYSMPASPEVAELVRRWKEKKAG